MKVRTIIIIGPPPASPGKIGAQERKIFDRLLDQVIQELPADVVALFEEIPLVVEDEPSAEILDDMGIELAAKELPDLCGLHSGIPLSDRSVFEGQSEPDQILIFRGPIFRLVEGSTAFEKELRHEIRITVLHELGHHFGLSEARLEELGYE